MGVRASQPAAAGSLVRAARRPGWNPAVPARVLWLGAAALSLAGSVGGRLLAAETNGGPSNLPTSSLRPPRGEILPGFWEQNGTWVILAAALAVALLGLLVWIVIRPKPALPVPLGVQARKELEPLKNQPEDGLLLSRTSQIVRRYLAAMFGLPAGELTTTEFCRAAGTEPKVGPDLARDAAAFLEACDLRKFAPTPAGPNPGAVSRALGLIERSEARLADLNRAAGNAEPGPSSIPPSLPSQAKGMAGGA